MIEFTRTHRDERGETSYVAYLVEEADERGMEYVYWKEAGEGDWALTDDGYVVECIGVYTVPNGNARQLKFSCGAPWATAKKYRFMDYYEVNAFSQPVPQDWQDKALGERRTKTAIQVYARMMLTGNVNWRVLGLIIDPGDTKPVKHARSRFRGEKLIEAVAKTTMELLSDHGMTQEDALDWFLEHKQKAFEDGTASDREKVIDRIFELTGLQQREQVRGEYQFDITTIPGYKEKGRITGEVEDANFEDVEEFDAQKLIEGDDE